MKRALLSFIFSSCLAAQAWAGVACTVPNTFVNNTIADANQVNANFTAVLNCLLAAAAAGSNSDITALNALSTPLTPTQGGSSVFLGGTSGGTANAQTVTISTPTGFSQTLDYTVIFIAGLTNTGPLTLNVNAQSVAPNFYVPTPGGPQPMTGGEIIAGQLVVATFDGTEWVMVSNGPQFGGFGPGKTLASAATTDVGKIGGHNVVITGTTPITSFGNSANLNLPIFLVSFNAVTTITYNQTNCATVGGCILTPGQSNITTAAGDVALLYYLGNGSSVSAQGNWQVIFYQHISGAAPVNPTPNCGFNVLTWGNGASSSTVTINWGSAALVNSSQVAVYSPAVAGKTLNITLGNATPTVGGMDGNPPGTNNFVYMYAISNGALFDVIGSPSPAAGSVGRPTGYTYICYLGAIRTNNTSNLLGTRGQGRDAHYVLGGANVSTGLPLNVNGAGGACNVPTYTPVIVALSSGANIYAPGTAIAVDLVLSNIVGGGPSAVAIAPNASYGNDTALTAPPLSIGTVGGTISAAAIIGRIFLESASVYWCGGAGMALMTYGWLDTVNAN